MKHKIFAILTAILFLSFSDKIISRTDYPEKNGKILLFEYDAETDFKVLKDYNKKKYPYIHGSRFPNVDYNSYNKILYVDKPINLSDSSKLIFLDTYNVMAISLPFKYSDIALESLVNDSTVQFTLNNKKLILKPGQEYFDSITSIETENKRVIQYNTKFHVQNRGFILRKNIITDKERMDRMNEELKIRDSIDIIDLEKLDKRK
jgi:hypothetical protein